jgi:hypothetical protein
VGFLNGVAIHIFLGQIGKVFGFDEVARDRAFASGVYAKAAADAFAYAGRGRANNRGHAGRQAMAAEVAGTLTGGGICGGACLQHRPGGQRRRGRGPGSAGIAAASVAGIRPRVHHTADGRGAWRRALKLQQRHRGRPKLRRQGAL